MKKEGKLCGEALRLANYFAFNEAELPRERFEQIGKELGDRTQDIIDLRILLRVEKKCLKEGERIASLQEV